MKRTLGRLAGLACGVSLLLAVGTATAAAQTVTTSGAINVTGTSATLVGFLDPGQFFTAYAFVYGTTTNYGMETPVHMGPAGNGNVEVSATVTGLSPATTYHVQLGAVYQPSTNVAPTPEYGGDETFTTTSSSSSGSGSGSSGKGSLRLVGRTLQVSHGKLSVALWCIGNNACRGTFSISSSGKRCVTGKSFSLGAGKVKAIQPKLLRACRALMRKAARHTVHGKLKATLSTGQPKLSSKVTLKPRL